MATYTLTSGSDTFGGTTEADTFQITQPGVLTSADDIHGGVSLANLDALTFASNMAGSYAINGSSQARVQSVETVNFLGSTSMFTIFSLVIGAATPLAPDGGVLRLNVTEFASLGFAFADPANVNFSLLITLAKGNNNQITGGALGDTVIGGTGSATLNGGAGNDRFEGGGGQDRFNGGPGNDTYVGSAFGGSALFNGELGDDRFESVGSSSGGQDTFFGGDGDDTYVGSSRRGNFSGDGGNDRFLAGAGGGSFDGGAGSNTLIAGSGNDGFYSRSVTDVFDQTVSEGNDSYAIAFTDAVGVSWFGGEGNDTFNGGAGNDSFNGGGGNDQFNGADGDDSALGGAGIDTLAGDEGADTLRGGDDNDTLDGGNGADLLDGGAGNDRLNTSGSGPDTLLGGDGADLALGNDEANRLDGGADNDTLFAGSGNDSLLGGGGDDSLDGSFGVDTIQGGSGDDRYRFTSGAQVSGGDGNDLGQKFWSGSIVGAMVDGGAGDDSLYDGDPGQTGSSDLFQGGDGNDTFYEGGGDDTFEGGAGNDAFLLTLGGAQYMGQNLADPLQAGADVFRPGAGFDTFFGGSGDDVVEMAFAELSAQDVLNGGDPALQTELGDTLRFVGLSVGKPSSRFAGVTRIEHLRFDDALNAVELAGLSSSFRTVTGGALADRIDLRGALTSPTLDGGAGADVLIGTETFGDTILGSAGADRLYGVAGADSLSGGLDNDLLDGGIGNDVLDGGAGDDRLLGGAGRDVLSLGVGNDVLLGGEGDDVLSALAADLTAADSLSGGLGAGDAVIVTMGAVTEFTLAVAQRFSGLEAITFQYDAGAPLKLWIGDNLAGSAEQRLTVRITGPARDVVVDATTSGWRGLQFFDTEGNTTLTSASGPDRIVGADGIKLWQTGRGDDELLLGVGRNTVDSGDGADAITLAGGLNVVTAGRGDDRIAMATGQNTVLGGDGADQITVGFGEDSVDAGNHDDLVTVAGTAWSSVDRFHGGFGLDRLTFTDQVTAADPSMVDNGLSGWEEIVLANQLNELHLGFGTGDPALAMTVTGGSNTDIINGGLRNIRLALSGGAGDDELSGGSQADLIDAGTGTDRVLAGAGHDVVTLGDVGSDDEADGGLGIDTLVLNLNGSQVVAMGSANFTGFERYEVAGGGAVAFGASFGNTVVPHLVTVTGTAAQATIIDARAASRSGDFRGGAGFDTLMGGFGADQLSDGAGTDVLSGGRGADRFTLADDGVADRIDFSSILDGSADITDGGLQTQADVVTGFTAVDRIGLDLGLLSPALADRTGVVMAKAGGPVEVGKSAVVVVNAANGVAGDDFDNLAALNSAFGSRMGAANGKEEGLLLAFGASGTQAGLYYFRDGNDNGTLDGPDQLFLLAVLDAAPAEVTAETFVL